MTLTIVPETVTAPVIQLDLSKQSEIKHGRQCRHTGGFTLYEETRDVVCAVCKAPLDAFRILLEYAERERHWRYYDREARDAKKVLAELKDEERKVKARTKSASRKDAAVAVAAERERTLRDRADLTALARDVVALGLRIERTARALDKSTEAAP